MSETPAQLYQAGRLTDAIQAINGQLRSKPTDADLRVFLAELLSFSGNLERADLQLDTTGTQQPQVALTIALFRQLIRADQARHQLHADGRVPEFLDGDQPEHLRLHLEAFLLLREGKAEEAAATLAKAEDLRPPLAGAHDGVPFDDFRDLDDLTGGLFEVLTSTGKYFWIPAERVELIEFHKPERPRDLLWRRAHMVVRDGPDGEVFLPAVYAGAAADAPDAVKLGRITEWSETVPVRGSGQRCFLIGEECVPILQVGTLTFQKAT